MRSARTTANMVSNGVTAFRKWIVPYARSRVRGDELRPLLSYLFTEYNCNMRCHYCYSHGSDVPGMTLETARSSIDWLKTTGCRVVAIMGGEPLLRRDFIVDVVRYGAERGFFMYLPTNGLLLTEDFIDRVSDAGVAAINLALDGVVARPGMPKGLDRVERQFETLVRRQRTHGYVLFLNMNITRHNLTDVRQLTRLARDLGLGVDYHLNERPHVDQPHWRHPDNDSYLRPEQWDQADELIDWLVEQKRAGLPMVNTVAHLRAMKEFMRGQPQPWVCRAGHNATCIRIDGSLAPCFGLYADDHDWGRIWEPRFDPAELAERRQQCMPHCLSTCQYNLGTYYDIDFGTVRWIWVHATIGV